ncbi:MAG TPA: hypothetical protein DHN33_04150 [Eubacteriaceae bacterium]|nr:hypothetical protein [Eubacteriaceae bacterium]
MDKKGQKRRWVVGLLLLFLLIGAGNIRAAGMTIESNSDKVSPGNYFSITLTFQAEEEIASIQADLSYDSGIIEYTSGGGNAIFLDGGSGSINDVGSGIGRSVTYNLSFRARKEGSGAFKVSNIEMIGESGRPLPVEGGSISVVVESGSGGEAPQEQDHDFDSGEPPDTESDLMEIEVDGQKLYLHKSWFPVELPEGFEEKSIEYKEESVIAGKQENSDLTIVGMSDETLSFQFFIYDQEGKQFYPFQRIIVNENYTLLPLGELFENSEKEKLLVNGQEVESLFITEDLYLIRAMDGEGQKSYYSYDTREQTFLRYEEDQVKKGKAVSSVSEVQDADDGRLAFVLLAGLGTFAVVLLIALLMVKRWH